MNNSINLKYIPCKTCGLDMPELRKSLYGYLNCVNCSTVKPKRANIITQGDEDDFFVDIEIIEEPEEFSEYLKPERNLTEVFLEKDYSDVEEEDEVYKDLIRNYKDSSTMSEFNSFDDE